MDGDEIGAREQLVLGYPPRPDLGRARLGQVLAPGQEVHAERLAEARDLGADVAEPDDAERGAMQIAPDPDLPAAGPHRVRLREQVAGERQDQA